MDYIKSWTNTRKKQTVFKLFIRVQLPVLPHPLSTKTEETMLTLDISDQPDVSLIVADTITLHVSSDKLKAIRAFERSFDPGPPGFKEGEEFKAHRESSSPELCKQKLPEGNPDGMRCPALALHSRNSDIVDALRESDASGPESPELKGLQSFATTVDFYQCVEVVRDAAPISGEEVSSYPHLVLLSVYLLDHAEQFTRLADHISKYEDHLVMADLKREAGLSHAGKELHCKLSVRKCPTFGNG